MPERTGQGHSCDRVDWIQPVRGMAGIPVVIVLAAVVASRAEQAAAAGSAAPAVALPSVPNLEQREWAIAVRMTHGASWSGGHRESSATG